MVLLTLGSGSRCAVLLPRKIINPQITPAKGLIVNRFLGNKSLVLIEEVWQILDLSPGEEIDINKVVFVQEKRIRKNKWGWKSVPEMLNNPKEYMAVELYPESIYPTNPNILDEMINKSITDFLQIKNLM